MEQWGLRAEERTGFEVEEDRETFLLEHRAYPGQLPWNTEEDNEKPQQGEAPFLQEEENVHGEEREWQELRVILEEELQRTRTYWRHRREQPSPQEERKVEISSPRVEGEEHGVVDLDLSQFPPHPTVPWPQRAAVSATPKATPQQEKGRQEHRGRRHWFSLELLLFLLILTSAVLLWYWGKQGGVVGEGGPARQGESGGKAGTVQAPFRRVGVIQPLELFQSLELPLLQGPTPTNTKPTPTTTIHPPQLQIQPQRGTSPITRSQPRPSHLSSSTNPSFFVVQVYASTSQLDALEVAEQLRRRGLLNVSVSSAHIRGQTWWRVRFGPYATRLQAEEAALNAGFSHAWVLRMQ